MVGRNHGVPASSWWGDAVPPVGPTGTAAIWRGNLWTTSVAGFASGARIYLPAADATIRWAWISVDRLDGTTDQRILGFVGQKGANAAAQWLNAWAHPRMRVGAGDSIIVLAVFPLGQRFQQTSALGSGPVTHGSLTMQQGLTLGNTVNLGAGFTPDTNAYGVDVLLELQ